MFHNIFEPEFDDLSFKSNEGFKIMRPQHLAADAMVREGWTCSVWVAITYMRVSLRNSLFVAITNITLDCS